MDFKQYQVSATMEKEISHRFIAHLIGLLLAFESILLLLCYFVSIMFGESDLKPDYSSKSLTPTRCLRRSSLRSVIGKTRFLLLSLNRNILQERGEQDSLANEIMKNFIKAFRLTIVMCVFLGISYVLVLWVFGKAAPQRATRFSFWEVGFTLSCIVIAVLTLMHYQLALSLQNSINNVS